MPKISKAEFRRRRQLLSKGLSPNGIAIFHSGREMERNGGTNFPFRQNSDFYYLCGFNEPEAALIILPGKRQHRFILFCRRRDRNSEIWDGIRSGPEGALSDFGAAESFPIDLIDEVLPKFLIGRSKVYYPFQDSQEITQKIMDWIKISRQMNFDYSSVKPELCDVKNYLDELRLVKSKAEISLMRTAAKITASAHLRAMRFCEPGKFEYQLQAEIEHEFALNGARYPAYPSIVGGGKNGCILHYVENSDVLTNKDLVLIDAGCEFEHYAADVTRTFPVSGTFNPAQRSVYEIVLNAQKAAIKQVRPGNRWNRPHDAAVRVITKGLLDLGLLKGVLDDLIKKEAYRDFYMHRTGHWLGLDVHDSGKYKVNNRWRKFEPGMVLTVEPGIYIAPDKYKIPSRWRGIGIRIEDDVLVTDQGCEVLTRNIPKEPDDIEKIMRQS